MKNELKIFNKIWLIIDLKIKDLINLVLNHM